MSETCVSSFTGILRTIGSVGFHAEWLSGTNVVDPEIFTVNSQPCGQVPEKRPGTPQLPFSVATFLQI